MGQINTDEIRGRWTLVLAHLINQLVVVGNRDVTESELREEFALRVGERLASASIRSTFGRALDWLLRANHIRFGLGEGGARLIVLLSAGERKRIAILRAVGHVDDAERRLNTLRSRLADLLKGD